MKARPALALLASALILAAAGGLVLLACGDGPAELRAVCWGTGLGGGGVAVEFALVGRALREARQRALGILLAGFGARLVVLMGVALWFHRSGYADPVAFAVCFLAGFLAGLPVLASLVAGAKSHRADAPSGSGSGVGKGVPA